MQSIKRHWFVLLVLLFAALTAAAQDDGTNRLTFSARLGFNISARFKSLNSLPAPHVSRTNPHGDAYNYDDGYVLPDATGNFGSQTWYWGYDDSSRQIFGNNILMSRSTLAGGAPAVTVEDDPGYGAELAYNRLLLTRGQWRFGFEVAANYLNLSLSDNGSVGANVLRTSDPYPFTPGTTPPAATPASPYQGSFEGPAFVIGDTPGPAIQSIVANGATIFGQRQFDADVWGFRLGPYVELPNWKKLRLSVSGGLAVGYVDGKVSWSETASIGGVRGTTVSGSGHADDSLFGFYIGATAAWQFSERWSAVAGVQYQNLGTFSHTFGGREVELDLSKSLFVTFGVGFSF